MKRRDVIFGLGAAALAAAAPVPALALASGAAPLRIGLTPVFLDDQAAFLNRWRDYLQSRIGSPVSFVQRSSYREISELIVSKAIDVAWMCGYPYVMERERLQLLAVPLYLGRPEYRSYLITQHRHVDVDSVVDLGGKVFAFSDPNSFSGFVYPRYCLHDAGHQLEGYFRRTLFTWSHRKVVEAVSVGLADGGAVAGYVWDTLARIRPDITSLTRVAARSPVYGFPPFVARADLDPAIVDAVRAVFVDMRTDPEGARLLGNLFLDGFVPGEGSMYAGIGDVARVLATG